jgi:hypothetical protein
MFKYLFTGIQQTIFLLESNGEKKSSGQALLWLGDDDDRTDICATRRLCQFGAASVNYGGFAVGESRHSQSSTAVYIDSFAA